MGFLGQIAAKLNAMQNYTVEDLRQLPPRLIRLHFSVVLERTVAELHGISCLALEEVAPPKKADRLIQEFRAESPDLRGACRGPVHLRYPRGREVACSEKCGRRIAVIRHDKCIPGN